MRRWLKSHPSSVRLRPDLILATDYHARGASFALRPGTMTLERQEFGKSGEDRAADELERRGYAILARRYRTRHGEIDIVARDGDTTVFVEVKARTTAEFGSAADAVTRSKQRQVVSMAWDYVVRNGLSESRCRFDVVAIDGVGEAAVITVYPNAFEA